jgi:hypothetical protein
VASFETAYKLICAELVQECDFSRVQPRGTRYGSATCDAIELTTDDLTPAGKALATELADIANAAKRRRNATARARNNAMKSLGMTRTPYGWE